MRKLFVSLPMRGLEISEIRLMMNDIHHTIESSFNEPFELIDTIIEETPTSDVLDDGPWYLGQSIQLLSTADICVFHPGWRDARGCIIEHMICALYNIPYVDMSIDYDFEKDDVVDNTYDINEYGQINSELSKIVEEDVEDALGFEPDREDDLV